MSKSWWQFKGDRPTGIFQAEGFRSVGRLYFPLCNEAGMLSSVTPTLQGSPTSGQNAFLGLPLSAEDLPHMLAHRDFWITEAKGRPFSLSGCSPDGLLAYLEGRDSDSVIEAGPGWFSLERPDPAGRFSVKATLWCPADLGEKIECMLVEVTNLGKRDLTLSPYAAVPLFARSADNLRDHRHVSALLHRTRIISHGVRVRPTMTFDERGHQFNALSYSALAFGPRGSAPEAIWPTQESFLGEGGSFAAPRAVWERQEAPALTNSERQGCEAIGGFRFRELKLRKGKTASYLVVSGICEEGAGPRTWKRHLGRPGSAKHSLEATKRYWLEKIQSVVFQTGDSQLDNWLVWVGFQPMLRRLYGNSFLPEFDYGRGGKGWRDLWQDCLALLLYEPEAVRKVLFHNFGGVRIDGSNATIIGHDGEFIADRNNIPRTWMDHGCWPTHTTLLYVDQTGDLNFVLQERSYFRDPQILRCHRKDPEWTEDYGYELRTRRGEVYKGTLLEHMLIQNVTAFFNVGEHNLCRLEGADWNDGMDMAEKRGESVAFSAFYAWNLERLADLVEKLAEDGTDTFDLAAECLLLLDRTPAATRVNYNSPTSKQRRLDQYLVEVSKDVRGRRVSLKAKDLVRDLRAKSQDISDRIRTQEWVKLSSALSCFNGYYDDNGRRVAGRKGRRVRMTLTGQVFPVMGGAASDEQIEDVIRSVRRYLWSAGSGGVRLNTDFGDVQPALGRAFSFHYGEKENGAVFSHMAVMYACALYQRRRAREGRRTWHALYEMAVDADRSRIFPCIPEYFNAQGRGMYCYLTGSASWMIYLLLTQVFGIRGEWGDLLLDPQLTRDDFVDGVAKVSTSFAGRRLVIEFRNPDRLEAGRYKVESVKLERRELTWTPHEDGGATIARQTLTSLAKGREHHLVVLLGKI